ncbi:MAG: hypothetical protein K0M70_11990 [Arenimonas sp.]|uniref:hypothetical protein n=1 Tax=Arenimonas sp. TaxID=1872635 RepID=UPI0025BC0140|nr:hypothetical protein [Arenimonas sp.]MBW8368561.1 hypothetical protein [Arenimonas sp.]
MRLSAFIATALLLSAPLLAAEPPPAEGEILFIGADESTPVSEVALVYFNQADNEGVRTRLGGITPYVDGKPARKKAVGVVKHGMAVVRAGRYELRGYCVTSLRDSGRSAVVDVEGGKRYHLQCTGRTPRTVALVATELGAPR